MCFVACVLGFGAWTALAQTVVTPTDQPLPGSQFQGGDGNQANARVNGRPLADWQGLQARGQVGHVADCPPPLTSPCPTASDNIFGGGNKELSPGDWSLTVQIGGGANPASANILDSYRAFHHATGHDAFLYLAFTRAASEGTVFLTFELNQVAGTWFNGHANIPCRTTGDILISFQPHGNVLDIFQVEEWVTSATDPVTHCATAGTLEDVPFKPDVDFQAAFNDSSIQNYLPPTSVTTIDAGDFGEAAINLSSVLSGDQEGCVGFASIWMYSQSSSAGQPSQMKDYVAPTPFTVRTCKASPSLASTASGIVNPSSHRTHGIRRNATHRLNRPRRPAVHRHPRPRRPAAHRHPRPGRRAMLGASIFDTAELKDGDNPTGTITFRLYGPKNPTCSGDPIFKSTVDVTGGNGSYNSAPYTPTAAGTYSWTVEYSGDDNNRSAGPTACGIDSETVEVSPAQPKLSTVASTATLVGNPISDSATLTNGSNPTGTITFHVYGPDNDTCSGMPADTSTVDVSHGNGTYDSHPFTPSSAGTYRWVATYSGDDNNNTVSTHCGDVGEAVVVSSPPPPIAKPDLTTTASPGVPAGSPIRDTAHLTGGSNPTGAITFYVYGPNNTGCDTPAAPPSTVPVSGAGDYHSALFTPTSTGTYRWVARYSGDANNAAAATSCGDSAETVLVTRARSAISTFASPVVVRSGGAVGDTALLTGGSNPQGTITFRLYGPNDNTCSAPPMFVGQQTVVGNGRYPSPTPTLVIAGTYRWVATYSGDHNNAGASTACRDEGETVVVKHAPPVKPEHEDEPKPKPKPKPKPHPPRSGLG